jgi:hypothetical protein
LPAAARERMRRWRVGAIIAHQVNADLELWQTRIIQGRER